MIRLPPSELDFESFSDINRIRASEWHPHFPLDSGWSLADWSNAMAGECGEACNIVKKIRRDEEGLSNIDDPPREELLDMLGEELADTYTYLDLLASKAGINLRQAIIDKFNKVSEKQGFPERIV